MWVALLFFFAIQLGFYALFWRLPSPVPKKAAEQLPNISLLICAKNEAPNLMAHLPFILNQNYPKEKWEVVVVNDASEDGTAALLEEMQADETAFKTVTIKPEAERAFPGKKHALIEGLKNCTHEVVLLTDADCYPASADWAWLMASAYQQMKELVRDPVLVLGFGAYEQKSGLLNAFIQWETLHTFMQYAAWTLRGKPYMAVGRNLLYEKASVLDLVANDKAFATEFSQTPSGDDDLIVSRLSNGRNAAVVADLRAKTISRVPQSWRTWFRQKSRHVSTGKFYDQKVKNLLGLYALSVFFFWIISLLLLVGGSNTIRIMVVLLIAFRALAFFFLAKRWRKAVGERKELMFFGDAAWTFYNVLLSPYIFWKNKQQWK